MLHRWAYATYTLLPMQEIGQNQHKIGGWTYTAHGCILLYMCVQVCASLCMHACPCVGMCGGV